MRFNELSALPEWRKLFNSNLRAALRNSGMVQRISDESKRRGKIPKENTAVLGQSIALAYEKDPHKTMHLLRQIKEMASDRLEEYEEAVRLSKKEAGKRGGKRMHKGYKRTKLSLKEEE